MADEQSVEATEALADEAQESPDLENLTIDELGLDEEDDSQASEEESESGDSAEESEAEESEQSDEEAEESEADQSDKTDTAEEQSDADRKRFNDEMAKQRIAAKQAREEAAQARKELEDSQIQRYLDEAGDESDLVERQAAVERYRLQQERSDLNRERLAVSLDRAVAEIDIFRSGTEVQKQYLLKAVDLFEAQHVKKDDKGNPIEVTGDLYSYLKTEAESIRELTQDGAAKEAKAKEKVRARTITPPTRAPKQKVDKDLEDFNKVFGY